MIINYESSWDIKKKQSYFKEQPWHFAGENGENNANLIKVAVSGWDFNKSVCQPIPSLFIL